MMTTVLPHEKLDLQTTPLSEERLHALKALVPEAFATGTLNMQTLLEAVGLMSEDTTPKKEAYGLSWAGKHEARKQDNQGTHWTLIPAPEESLHWDTTQNIVIEADNLVALKLLQKGYTGKIDLIYIDPPYNVDADTVYNDNYTEDIKAYEQRSGKRDDAGNLLDTYKDKGHKHSQWLNMMYPRLKLMKKLLKSSGVIFVSIDDKEVANLKLLMDEIFGEDNFVAVFPWRQRTAKSDVTYNISKDCENIVVYTTGNGLYAGTYTLDRKYYTTDDFPDNPWRIHELTKQTTATERPNSFFTIICPNTGKEYPANPDNVWRITKETYPDYLAKHRIVFPGQYPFLKIKQPVLRYFQSDDMLKDGDNYGLATVSTVLPKDVGMTADGTKEIKELGLGKAFLFPKPSSLIKYLLKIITSKNKNAVILDCFAGSGTTGHAVMQLNAEDGGNRQYICVQIPDTLDPKNKNQATACQFLDGIGKPRTIAEITKERLRRAGAKLQQEYPDATLDLGFKVFKQAPSQQLKTQETFQSATMSDTDLESRMEAQLMVAQKSIPLETLNPLHLAYEVMLKYHTHKLTAPIEPLRFAGHEACFRLGGSDGALCIFSKTLNVHALLQGLIALLETDDSSFPPAIYMLEDAFHSAGSLNDCANALEQLSIHCNIGHGNAEGGDLPTLKFYTL
ncbi:MAG: site-specific DNA-methyltransferase [Vampirovibrionales bacterium]